VGGGGEGENEAGRIPTGYWAVGASYRRLHSIASEDASGEKARIGDMGTGVWCVVSSGMCGVVGGKWNTFRPRVRGQVPEKYPDGLRGAVPGNTVVPVQPHVSV